MQVCNPLCNPKSIPMWFKMSIGKGQPMKTILEEQGLIARVFFFTHQYNLISFV